MHQSQLVCLFPDSVTIIAYCRTMSRTICAVLPTRIPQAIFIVMILTKAQKEREKRKAQKQKTAEKIARTPRESKAKYNWPLIKQLYMAGMDKKELQSLPECQGITDAYLSKVIYGEGWPEERRAQENRMKFILGTKLEDAMKGAMEAHYRFMLKEIEDERAILAKRIKTTSLADQKERIDLLIKFEGVVRKTLGLDDMTPGDANKNAYNFILSVQSFNGPVRAREGASAVLPFPGNQTQYTANLAQLRGMPEAEGGHGLQENPEGEGGRMEVLPTIEGEGEGLRGIDMTAEGILANYRLNGPG